MAQAKINDLKTFESALRPLGDRYGTARVDGFLRAIKDAGPLLPETLDIIGKDADNLLKLKPSADVITQIARITDRAYKKDSLDHIIAKLSSTKMAIILMKRNEEFLNAVIDAGKKLSEISPLLFMVLLNDQPFRELMFFSAEGLGKWVEEGKKKFCIGNNKQIPEFCRYCMMCAGYEEVAQYKISQNSVFLEDVQDMLTKFARMIFNMRLVVAKSRTRTPNVNEQDELRMFLPDYAGDYQEKEDNKLEYCMHVTHEGSHILLGSFNLDVFSISDFFAQNGIKITNMTLKDNNMRIKNMKIEKEGKPYLATSLFHLIPLLADEGHGEFLKTLINQLEDLRMDSFWLDEKAPGYRKDYQRMMEYFFFKLDHWKVSGELDGANFIKALMQTVIFTSAVKDRPAFMQMLKTGNTEPGFENIIENMRKMDPKVLDAVLGFENELLELAGAREKNVTRTFITSIRMYQKVKHLIKEAQKNSSKDGIKEGDYGGMSGPLSLDDLDLENIEFSADPGSMDPNDLPEEIRKKIEQKLKDLKPEDKTKLAQQLAQNIPKNDPKEAALQPNEVHGRWDTEVIDGIEVKSYTKTNIERLNECQSMADSLVSGNIRNMALRLMASRTYEDTGEMAGEIDPIAKREWNMARRQGRMIPRDYHVLTEHVMSRSISILTIGDASGSTGQVINGKRKIDYLTVSVHSLADGLDGIPGIRSAYGFFNSNGRDNITLYLGKDFNESVRFAKSEPSRANRDGAIIRKAGELLSNEKSDMKAALFVLDSMPADMDNYNGKKGVEDVRHAFSELRNAKIAYFVITVSPDNAYYEKMFKSEDEYLNYIYGKGNYHLIGSEKELPAAFDKFTKMRLKGLRRHEYE